jgi:hypothetical protein
MFGVRDLIKAKETAQLKARVVFPTPPLLLAKTIFLLRLNFIFIYYHKKDKIKINFAKNY